MGGKAWLICNQLRGHHFGGYRFVKIELKKKLKKVTIIAIFTFEQEKKTHNFTNNHDVDDEGFFRLTLGAPRAESRPSSLLVFNQVDLAERKIK